MGIFDSVSVLLGNRKIVPQKQKEKKPQKTHQVIQTQQPVDTAMFDKLLLEAQTQARAVVVEAKDEAVRIKNEAQELVRQREELIDRRQHSLEMREQTVSEKEKSTIQKLMEIEEIKSEQLAKLERAAHLTKDEAKQLILKAVEEKMDADIAKKIREAEEKAKEESDKKARVILVDSMRHGATNYVPEYTVSIVKLPDEDMKGRIIGKGGNNIRALETATGVDFDLDEEGVIRLSSFDPVRREIARVTLERLMKDGRIQPVRIEELVEQVKKDIEKIMFEAGEKLCHDVGVYNLPSPLVGMLGRFKYRFSYGQNMIAHTLEETKIGIALAHEIKAEVNVVRLGCLLHDIGKVVMDEEGSHVELGVELLKKHNIPQAVIDCVAQHHEDTPFTSVESMLVYISDAISGSRPGARYEDIESYIKRLKDLEEIARMHTGVKDVYAFQAGRELRVIVEPDKVDDNKAVIMAQAIKEEIEKKLTYPGNIRITVIRETRAVDVAK